MSPRRLLRALLPFGVTAAIFWAISRRIDWPDVVAHLRADTLRILVPALIAYAGLSLAIDAVSLVRASPEPREISLGTWARLKAATYPIGILHYALGVAALVVLLRRRTTISFSGATSPVMLIAGLDLLAVLLTAFLAGAFASELVGMRVGAILVAAVAAPLGLFLLRTERKLGPLEWLRQLDVLRSARDLPTPRLLELFALRLGFVAVFVGLGGAALASFGLRASPGTVIVGFAQVALVAAVPIAVAGLGTSQAAFLYVFRSLGPADQLLACSVALSAGMIAVRVGLGVFFVREFSQRLEGEEGSRA